MIAVVDRSVPFWHLSPTRRVLPTACRLRWQEKRNANQAIVPGLARELAVRRRQIELVRGPTSSAKRFLFRGVTPAELTAKIDAAVARAAGD